jgi:hypothetical protein
LNILLIATEVLVGEAKSDHLLLPKRKLSARWRQGGKARRRTNEDITATKNMTRVFRGIQCTKKALRPANPGPQPELRNIHHQQAVQARFTQTRERNLQAQDLAGKASMLSRSLPALTLEYDQAREQWQGSEAAILQQASKTESISRKSTAQKQTPWNAPFLRFLDRLDNTLE